MYVPYDSARIQTHQSNVSDKDRFNCAKYKMANILAGKLEKLPVLIRLNINFKITE